MNVPSVAVVIPTFNRADACLAALQSVCAQTYGVAQIIVVDDGSSENLDQIRELLIECGGLFLRQENKGVAAARNLGVRHSSHEWIAFLDSDDLWLPTKLEKQIRLHKENPDLVISQTKELWMRNEKLVKQRAHQHPGWGECFNRSLDICCISASAVMIRRDVFIAAGGFDEQFPICEDYDLWLKLTSKFPVGLIDEALVIKNRGRDDHLSESLPALDRFRVKALINLLSQGLSLEQRTLVLCSLNRKLEILEAGAQKRGLQCDIENYRAMRQKFLESD